MDLRGNKLCRSCSAKREIKWYSTSSDNVWFSLHTKKMNGWMGKVEDMNFKIRHPPVFAIYLGLFSRNVMSLFTRMKIQDSSLSSLSPFFGPRPTRRHIIHNLHTKET